MALVLLLLGIRFVRELAAGRADLGLGDLVVPKVTLAQRLGLLVAALAFVFAMPLIGFTLGLFLFLMTGMIILSGLSEIKTAYDHRTAGLGRRLPAVHPVHPGAVPPRSGGSVPGLAVLSRGAPWAGIATLLLDLFAHSFSYWWVIIPAVLLGTIVGAVPGFSAANTIIILLPLTLAINVEAALIFMMALYCASQLGNGIPAILVNIPGTGGAAATTLDGYPMAKKGEAQEALIVCFVASVMGGLIGTLLTLIFLPYLARVGFVLHSVEMVVMMLFGLALIAAIAAQDMLKALLAGLLGLLIGAIGADHIYSTPRATFGFIELYDGVPLVPALIGLFAISEAFVMIEERMIVSREGATQGAVGTVERDLARARPARCG